MPKTEEPAAPPAPSWSAPSAPPVESAPAPPPWTPPAPAASAPAPAPVEQPAEPSSTDAILAAGAAAPVESAPRLPWEAPAPAAPSEPEAQAAEPSAPDVAATMMMNQEAAATRDSTTLMPAWQPPPAPAPAAEVAEAMAIDSKTQPMIGTAPGGGRQAELTIEVGPDAGHSHRTGGSAMRLGRSPDNDVILRDPATSGHHARLERRGDQFWLVDLGSTNGTLVNDEPIQERELAHGDRVSIGQNTVITFSVIES
jgi:FHA domain-containing protein